MTPRAADRPTPAHHATVTPRRTAGRASLDHDLHAVGHGHPATPIPHADLHVLDTFAPRKGHKDVHSVTAVPTGRPR
jgi:hypothetical protein